MYRRSLVRPPLPKNCSFTKSGPQGLRRPRFSFFRFTCQRARRTMSPNLCNQATEPSAPDRLRVHFPPNIVEELQRHAIAPRRRRTVSALICPLAPDCQPDSAPKSRAVDNSPRGLTGLMLHTWGGPLQASNTQADMVRSSLISRARAVLPPQCRALCSRRGQGVPSKFVCRNLTAQGVR